MWKKCDEFIASGLFVPLNLIPLLTKWFCDFLFVRTIKAMLVEVNSWIESWIIIYVSCCFVFMINIDAIKQTYRCTPAWCFLGSMDKKNYPKLETNAWCKNNWMFFLLHLPNITTLIQWRSRWVTSDGKTREWCEIRMTDTWCLKGPRDWWIFIQNKINDLSH